MATRQATEGRPARLYDGDTFTLRGYTFRFKTERDEFMGAPWEEHDGHGPVSAWTTREKGPGERVLAAARHGRRRYYDFAEAVRIARRDGWGPPVPGESKRQQAARAVEEDFEYCRSWAADEWEWLGVVVTLEGEGRDERESRWGIESLSDPAYFVEVAYELAGEILSRVEVDEPDVQVSEN